MMFKLEVTRIIELVYLFLIFVFTTEVLVLQEKRRNLFVDYFKVHFYVK